jgi:hypothetical protein
MEDPLLWLGVLRWCGCTAKGVLLIAWERECRNNPQCGIFQTHG